MKAKNANFLLQPALDFKSRSASEIQKQGMAACCTHAPLFKLLDLFQSNGFACRLHTADKKLTEQHVIVIAATANCDYDCFYCICQTP